MILDISFLDIKYAIKYVELATAVVGSIYAFKYKHTYLKYFLVLLWGLVLMEFFGYYYYLVFGSNYIVYNIYYLINFSFLLSLYYVYVRNPKHIQAIRGFMIAYVLSFFVNWWFQDYFIQIQTIPFMIGAVGIIMSVIFYFLEILNTEKVLYVSKNLLFWISIGLLLYFVGKIPTRMVRNYWEDFSNYEVIFMVEYLLSIIMNICFIIGFICSEKNKPY